MKIDMFRPSTAINMNPNVFIDLAKGYYDKKASQNERLILLEGSIINNNQGDKNIEKHLQSLVANGFLEERSNGYFVKKPFAGSVSGTAAAVLGKKNKNPRISGYEIWTFTDGKTIDEAGERPPVPQTK